MVSFLPKRACFSVGKGTGGKTSARMTGPHLSARSGDAVTRSVSLSAEASKALPNPGCLFPWMRLGLHHIHWTKSGVVLLRFVPKHRNSSRVVVHNRQMKQIFRMTWCIKPLNLS